MQKIDYLKFAILNKLYIKKNWMISCFSITKESSDLDKANNWLGKIIRESWGYSFINENQELIKIEDADIKEPIFRFKDRIIIDNTWLPNIKGTIETQIGNLLVNAISIVPSFNTKIDFLLGKISVSKIEEIVAKKLTDTPKENEQRSPDLFYVDEYINFCNSLQYIDSLTQLTSYAATPKNIVAPPGVKEFKRQLIEKYKDKLHDPVELANFESELLAFDSAFLKDDPSNGTFLTKKIMNIARKRMYLDFGYGTGFTNALTIDPILNSLEEGWPQEPKQLTTMMNEVRAGAFARGAETINGGVAAKRLLRAANNFKIIDSDCGTKLGLEIIYTSYNAEQLIGRYILVKDKFIKIENIDQAKLFLDKKLIVRSPMYCKLDGDNICKVCAGDKLFKFPKGVVIPITDISAIILASSMSAMHGKVLATEKLDLNEVMS